MSTGEALLATRKPACQKTKLMLPVEELRSGLLELLLTIDKL